MLHAKARPECVLRYFSKNNAFPWDWKAKSDHHLKCLLEKATPEPVLRYLSN